MHQRQELPSQYPTRYAALVRNSCRGTTRSFNLKIAEKSFFLLVLNVHLSVPGSLFAMLKESPKDSESHLCNIPRRTAFAFFKFSDDFFIFFKP
jgi:hypothetical protein